MDVGRESDNDDAIDGELNPINQENSDDEVQYGYRGPGGEHHMNIGVLVH